MGQVGGVPPRTRGVTVESPSSSSPHREGEGGEACGPTFVASQDFHGTFRNSQEGRKRPNEDSIA
eukprot:3010860-Pyramimonas_sp.AAC.1